MKITLFIGSLGRGGAERVLCGLADYLSLRHTVELLTLTNDIPAYELEPGIRRLSLVSQRKSKFLIEIERLKLLKEYVKKNRNNIYLAFLPAATFMLLLMRPWIKGKIFFSIRNDPKREYHSRILKFIARVCFPWADGIVFQTNDAKEFFEDFSLKKSEIIPNPINQRFLEQLTELKQSDLGREKIIIAVGRLNKQKNFPLLIHAFSQIVKIHKEYKLHIFGEGEERQYLEQIIINQNLEKKCFLKGNTDNIACELVRSEIFVSTSDYEGISNALLEAMAAGLAIISTDWSGGGARMLITDKKNGLLISRRNESELVSSLDRLITNKSYRVELMQNAAQVKEKYLPESIYQKWEEFLCN